MEYIGNVILPHKILYGAKVVCSGGKIEKIQENAAENFENLPYIAPGFVDIHNHGALGHDYMESANETFRMVADYLTTHGVVATQATTVSAPVEQIETFFNAYRAYQKTADESRCRYIGIHIEGPYIAPVAKGAHPLETLLTPAKDGYQFILDNSDIVTEVTVAPELDGMEQMIKDLTAKGIVISGGHDGAEMADVKTAAAAGMTHCTHIYCAMSTIHRVNGRRALGLAEYAMASDTLTAEMIGDNYHMPPELARAVYKCKGADKLCLVSDAIGPAGLPEDGSVYNLGTGENCTKVIVEGGVALVSDRSCYAGSVQALDQMVRNMVNDCGVPLYDAVQMATLTPAKVLNIDSELGAIEAGKRADLCFLDQDLKVIKTVINDKVVFNG